MTFSNGQTVPFTVVGTIPAGDLAIVRAQGVSGSAGDQLTHLGFDDFVTPLPQQLRRLTPDDEQLFVLGAAQTIEDHRDALGARVEIVLEHPVDQRRGQLVGGGHGLVGDTGLTVKSQPQTHMALGHGEQRMVGTRQRAPIKGHTEGAGRGVAASATRTTPARSRPSSAAALAHLNTVKSPAMPRRLASSPFGALATSSVTAK